MVTFYVIDISRPNKGNFTTCKCTIYTFSCHMLSDGRVGATHKTIGCFHECHSTYDLNGLIRNIFWLPSL